jgi:Holliday junction resolvasome RuvABC endonuclease subunit
VFGLTFGCAHSHDKFYYPDGALCAEVKSTVFGTGETEKEVVSDCVDLLYDTKDTGFSDNATELGGKIAEGAVKGVVPGP